MGPDPLVDLCISVLKSHQDVVGKPSSIITEDFIILVLMWIQPNPDQLQNIEDDLALTHLNGTNTSRIWQKLHKKIYGPKKEDDLSWKESLLTKSRKKEKLDHLLTKENKRERRKAAQRQERRKTVLIKPGTTIGKSRRSYRGRSSALSSKPRGLFDPIPKDLSLPRRN